MPVGDVGGYPVRDVLGADQLAKGMPFCKIGAVTGETCGAINNIDGDVVEASVFSLEGDSGSPGFVEESRRNRECRRHSDVLTRGGRQHDVLHPRAAAAGAVGLADPAVAGLQAGWPNTATTTERSRLFSDHTPITVLAQSDMIPKSTGS